MLNDVILAALLAIVIAFLTWVLGIVAGLVMFAIGVCIAMLLRKEGTAQ